MNQPTHRRTRGRRKSPTLPELEQGKGCCPQQPSVPAISPLLGPCDERIHRLVLLRASTGSEPLRRASLREIISRQLSADDKLSEDAVVPASQAPPRARRGLQARIPVRWEAVLA